MTRGGKSKGHAPAPLANRNPSVHLEIEVRGIMWTCVKTAAQSIIHGGSAFSGAV